MKKDNKHAQKIKQQKAIKRKKSAKAHATVKSERLNMKANKLDEMKKKLQEKWLELVNKQFQEMGK